MSGLDVRFEGDTVRATLCRPLVRNALGAEEWQRLESLEEELASSREADFVVLASEGDCFCAGVDLALIEAARQRPEGMIDLIRRNGSIVARLGRVPQLLIVAVDGPAIGIGMHLALAGDFLLATRRSYFWLPEAQLGLVDVFHHGVLERCLGRHGAAALALLGRKLPAGEALRLGIIGECFDTRAALDDAVDDMRATLRKVPRGVRRAYKARAVAGLTDDLVGQVEAMQAVLAGAESSEERASISGRQAAQGQQG